MSRCLLPLLAGVALAALGCGEGAFKSAADNEAGASNAGKGSGGKGSVATSGDGGEPTGAAGDESEGGSPPMGGKSPLGGNAGNGGATVVVAPPIPLEGLELWLRADDGISETNGVVSQWKDGSGKQHHGAQTALAARPKLVSNALSGKPALVFDGVDDFLELPALEADISGGVSMFLAFQQDEVGECGAWFEASNGREIQELHFGDWQSSVIYEIAESWLNDTSHPLLLTKPQITAAIHQQDQLVKVRSNGSLVGQGMVTLPATHMARQYVYVAKTLYNNCKFFKGRIGEILLYSRPVSTSELLDIEDYLQSKWACCGT